MRKKNFILRTEKYIIDPVDFDLDVPYRCKTIATGSIVDKLLFRKVCRH